MTPTFTPLAAPWAAALLAAALTGCASPKPGPGGATPTAGPIFGGVFGSGLSPALEAQRERLRDALQGTPVVIEATGDHQLRIEVPTKHAFDAGRATVKPALGAVLDQFAIGFKPYAATTQVSVAAPDDGKSPTRLVQERAASTRDYLVARGVPVSRIVDLDRADGPGLELLVSDRPLKK